MANPFAGLISTAIKNDFDNAIKALLESGTTGTAVKCRLNFGTSKFTLCENCIYDPIGKKSSNRYITGGPVPFANGQICPLCNGAGRIAQDNSEEIDLAVIWDHKSWIDLGVNINAPEGYAQTISEISSLPKIKKAKDVIFSIDIEKHAIHRFVRYGEPTPMGIGRDSFVVTMWQRAN